MQIISLILVAEQMLPAPGATYTKFFHVEIYQIPLTGRRTTALGGHFTGTSSGLCIVIVTHRSSPVDRRLCYLTLSPL